MSKKKIIVIFSIIIALSLLLFFVLRKPAKSKYETATVIEKNIIQTVEATGTVNPVQTVSIGSQISGIIKEIYVDYNSHVKKGQLLALIDPALTQAQVNQAEATLKSKISTYEKAKSTLEYNKKKYERLKVLHQKDYISKDDLDLAKSNYYAQKAATEAAAADIAQAKASLQTSKTNLRYTKIISPVDVVVISKEVEIGQTVAASFQTPTLFKVAKDLSDMQIETSVSEADIGKVREGQEVLYTIDGYPDRIFKGEVAQVRLASTTTNNVVTYSVIIDVENEDGVLLPGMTANVEIITSKKEHALVVPNMALKFTPDIKGKKYDNQGVWIINKGKLQRVDVKVGVSDDAHTEVASDKIQKGTVVIITGKSSKDKQSGKRRMPPPM